MCRKVHVLLRPHGSLGAVGCPSLAQNGFDMDFDGGFRDIELKAMTLLGAPSSKHLRISISRAESLQAFRSDRLATAVLLSWKG